MKKVIIKELEDTFFENDILEKINENNGFLYKQKLNNTYIGVYKPYYVEIKKELKNEIENILKNIVKKLFPGEIEDILKNNIFRIDGVLDKNNNFNIVEINSHFPRLYMLNQKSLKKYGLKKEYDIFYNNLKNVFLQGGKYKKINIIYDKNIDAIEDNLKVFKEEFKDIIDNIFSLKYFEENIEEVEKKLKQNPNIYRMVIQIIRLEDILKKVNIENLRIINQIKVGEIGKKANLSIIDSIVLPKTKRYLAKDFKQNYIVPEDKILKISYSTEGKGIFLPGEKFQYQEDDKNKDIVLQDYIDISKITLKNKEKKYNDLNFFIVNGEIIGAMIRLSDNKIVNVSAGGTFASCVLNII